MNGRFEYIRDKVLGSADRGLRAELHYLFDRVATRDQIIASLRPDQWKSIASRVPPDTEKSVRRWVTARDWQRSYVKRMERAQHPEVPPRATDGFPSSDDARIEIGPL